MAGQLYKSKKMLAISFFWESDIPIGSVKSTALCSHHPIPNQIRAERQYVFIRSFEFLGHMVPNELHIIKVFDVPMLNWVLDFHESFVIVLLV